MDFAGAFVETEDADIAIEALDAVIGDVAAAAEADIAAGGEALKGNTIGSSMLSVRRRAGDMHRVIRAPGFECAHIEIDVGVIPAVRLRYRAEDESDQAALPER